MEKTSTLNERVRIFEDTLRELTEEFGEKRIASAFCYEADIRMHLACKLLSKLPAADVHAELPIPLEIRRFGARLMLRGKTGSRNCVKADIAIIDSDHFCPQIIVELKFKPLYWSFVPLLTVPRDNNEENKNWLREALSRELNSLQVRRSAKLSQKDIENMYFGPHEKGPTTVEKIIQVLTSFKNEKQDVRAYLVVFDEIYPNIQDILEEAIDHYNPPDSFKVIAKYDELDEILQDTLNDLTRNSSE